jgi:arylsulfatase A-like enzyme
MGFDYWKVLPGQGNYYNPDFRTPDGRQRIEGYVTDIITDEAIRFLENRNPEKPFMLMFQHKAPHRAWWPNSEHFDLYNEIIPEPETLFDDYEGRGSAAREQEMEILNHMHPAGDNKLYADSVQKYQITGTGEWGPRAYRNNLERMTESQRTAWNAKHDDRNKEFWEDIPDNDHDLLKKKYQYYMQDYLRCIASVDDNIGRLMRYLDESGLRENTLVVYNSDQGFYLGEHGWFDKRFMYEESFRTPLIMRWPSKIKPGSVNKDLVQNLDIAETLLDVAGAGIPRDMQGVSLLPILEGREFNSGREGLYYHYYEYPAVHMVKRHYGIRTERYKLIHFYYDIDEWELYDLEKDPHELTNVYDQDDYQEVVADLKTKLESLMNKYGDSEELRNSMLPVSEQ